VVRILFFALFFSSCVSFAKIEHFADVAVQTENESHLQKTVCTYSGTMTSFKDTNITHEVKVEPGSNPAYNSKWITITDLTLFKSSDVPSLEFYPVGGDSDGLYLNDTILDDTTIARRIFGNERIIVRDESQGDQTVLGVYVPPSWWETQKLRNNTLFWGWKWLAPNFRQNQEVATLKLQFTGCHPFDDYDLGFKE
jgi:hypothetical protein